MIQSITAKIAVSMTLGRTRFCIVIKPMGYERFVKRYDRDYVQKVGLTASEFD